VKLWPRNLGARMTALLLAALLLAQLVSLGIFLVDRRSFMRDVVEESLTSRLPAVVRALRDLSPGSRDEVLAALGSRWSRYAVGDAALASAGADDLPAMAERIDHALGLSGGATHLALTAPETASLLGPASRVASDAAAVLQVSVPLGDGRWLNIERPIYPAWWHFAWRMGLPLLVSALAVLLTAALMARRITRPLAQLADSAERLGRGETVPALPERGPDDVARTVRAFNLMSERLQRFVDDRTRMLAAVSHDLRSPITALRIRAEMIGDDTTRERIVRSLDEMHGMVEATLGFARAEAQTEETREIDLAGLMRDVAGDADPAGGRVRLQVPVGPLWYRCRPIAMSRALRNVIDNALRYGGSAAVTLRTNGGGIVVTVEDEGPGIEPSMLEKAFEPFFRIEPSRSGETGGHGLGLAITRTIVHSHGGRIELENRSEGGLRVVIRLP